MTNPLVSIIIPVYNEEKYIRKCLLSLHQQTYNNIEIIVVNDGSTDKTSKHLKDLKSKVKNLDVLSTDHIGTAKARNLAAKKSKGFILTFVDADMHVDKNYIKDLVKPILEGKSKGTFTKEEYVANTNNIWATSWNLEYSQNKTRRIPLSYPNKSVVFRALLKTEFDRIGGYDQIAYMQDWTISKKLGYKAIAVKGARVYHFNPGSMMEVFNQAKWIATRPYKLGEFGRFIALIRASLPISVLMGVVGLIKYQVLFYPLFKIVYDFGIFCGILKYWVKNNHAQ